MIDKATLEIRQDEAKVVYNSLDEVAEDLPDHSPRYVLLSYPLTMVRKPGRQEFVFEDERLTFPPCVAGRTTVSAVCASVLPPGYV